MSEIRKKVNDTEYVLVWVPASKEVMEHNYIDTIDFMIQIGDKEKVVVEGRPDYDNSGNGSFSEWARLHTEEGDDFDLLDLLKLTKLSNVNDVKDWPNCLVRITVEVLKLEQTNSGTDH